MTKADTTNHPSHADLLAAYNSGSRFMLTVSLAGVTRTLFLFNRPQLESTRKSWQSQNANVNVFYLLPDGSTRPCARGKRT